MAAKNKNGPSKPAGAEYDPDARYRVRLRKPHKRRARVLSPQHLHVLTGRVLADIPPEVIADVEPV